MTGPLLAAAGALLAWPRGRNVPAVRPAGIGGVPAAWRERSPASALAVVPAALCGAVLGGWLVAVLAGGCAGIAASASRRNRRVRLAEQRLGAFTEALGALAAELRSGRPLEEAAAAAGGACGDRAGGEALVRAVRAPGSVPAPSLGAGTEEVAVARLAAAVQLSVRTGCSLASVVGAVEDDLRARRRHRLELRSALAGPRASAALLAGLPLLALLMGTGMGAGPWHVLTTTATGQVLLVLGVTLEGAGLAWTGRLVRRAAR